MAVLCASEGRSLGGLLRPGVEDPCLISELNLRIRDQGSLPHSCYTLFKGLVNEDSGLSLEKRTEL